MAATIDLDSIEQVLRERGLAESPTVKGEDFDAAVRGILTPLVDAATSERRERRRMYGEAATALYERLGWA